VTLTLSVMGELDSDRFWSVKQSDFSSSLQPSEFLLTLLCPLDDHDNSPCERLSCVFLEILHGSMSPCPPTASAPVSLSSLDSFPESLLGLAVTELFLEASRLYFVAVCDHSS